MPAGVMRSGKWRIKPSSRLPIFLRYVINASFIPEAAKAAGFDKTLPNRIYVKYMMYWPAQEYDSFEKEIVDRTASEKGWIENFLAQELKRADKTHALGEKLLKVDWSKKTNQELISELKKILEFYYYLVCPWYTQHPLDEYFEDQVNERLAKYVSPNDPQFKKLVQVFTDPKAMTEVAWEHHHMLQLAKKFGHKNFDKLVANHVKKYGYINRGLATGKPYTTQDIINRIKEARKGDIDEALKFSSPEKLEREYKQALDKVKPDPQFKRIIDNARMHSFMRNRRVEEFFFCDWAASFLYNEITKRTKFNPDLIAEVSPDEMIAGLQGKPMPTDKEMRWRLKDYAMVVKNSKTTLISDPVEIEKLAKEYYVEVSHDKRELRGMVASPGYGKGKARVFMDAIEIKRMERGDILVAQFTTPDFVPAMEKAAAIVTDQGGVSSHAAIVSRELGVPCVIATKEATRIIKEGDMVEVDAKNGIVKVIERA